MIIIRAHTYADDVTISGTYDIDPMLEFEMSVLE